MIDPTARQAWVGANDDWLTFLLRNGGGVQLHNVYTGMTVHVPPLSSSTGLCQKNLWTFSYDLINPILKKIAIVRPPAKYRDFEDYDLIIVFDKRIVIIGRCDVTNSWYDVPDSLTWYMLATPHLTPWRYEDAVCSGGRYFAVTNSGDCYMWDPNDGGKACLHISHGVYVIICFSNFSVHLYIVIRCCFVSIAGSMQPPISIRAP